MRGIDKRAIEKFGIPAILLMENAGYKASCIALDMLYRKKRKKVICVSGKGNNGGDGFVCARHLINKGIDTDIFLIGSSSELKKDAEINYKILMKMGKTIRFLNGKKDFYTLKAKFAKAQLLIDAIFGIGLLGEVKEPYRSIIDLMNQSKKPILALDIPSGLNATTGKVVGACIKAARTVTFACPKAGFIKNDGPLYIGKLITADISIPKVLLP